MTDAEQKLLALHDEARADRDGFLAELPKCAVCENETATKGPQDGSLHSLTCDMHTLHGFVDLPWGDRVRHLRATFARMEDGRFVTKSAVEEKDLLARGAVVGVAAVLAAVQGDAERVRRRAQVVIEERDALLTRVRSMDVALECVDSLVEAVTVWALFEYLNEEEFPRLDELDLTKPSHLAWQTICRPVNEIVAAMKAARNTR